VPAAVRSLSLSLEAFAGEESAVAYQVLPPPSIPRLLCETEFPNSNLKIFWLFDAY
jgi:hypothetical protein